MESLRRSGLSGTAQARAQAGTIRLKLLKIGAVVVRNTRRIRIWFSSSFPFQELFKNCLAHFYG
jgi:Transposase DDE domain group 1